MTTQPPCRWCEEPIRLTLDGKWIHVYTHVFPCRQTTALPRPEDMT